MSLADLRARAAARRVVPASSDARELVDSYRVRPDPPPSSPAAPPAGAAARRAPGVADSRYRLLEWTP